jgi:hypothetical protein
MAYCQSTERGLIRVFRVFRGQIYFLVTFTPDAALSRETMARA